MTTITTAVTLVAYTIGFQTLIYLVLPNRFHRALAPAITGTVGTMIVVISAIWFGPDAVGLANPDGGLLAAWGSGTVLLMSTVGLVMLARPPLRDHLADPRIASMTLRQAMAQIMVRIPVTTALIEEAVFRGVLHSALIVIYPEPVAMWAGAALFGLWHIGPGLQQARAVNRHSLAGVAHVLITVIGTTVAGAGLVWLRIETGSIWVPLVVHAGVNMTMAIFARLAAGSSRIGLRHAEGVVQEG